ncbi:Fic/DOC family N-terminal domain-containing protein [Corynebacterium felinum]|uniref:Fic family protein n=3 Tax=Corynebacterium felinum TaxID=131318 RepID=UPI0023F8494A|nr:Fic/DOC family N-terminal domain-containing protein [Corynebacterium felinum]MDF5820369.1 Fic/DOC family N-terminal domain-containing protein [Corynebacterium felinum]WJY93810.1 Adenosine monophosphate-protein transferase SoFic [Corynebacterium felinum]
MFTPRFDPNRPYNDLPPLPPAQDIETPAVLKKIIQARTALARLDMACHLIPNPDTITATIPLLEARASSAIENIITTHDELFKAAWKVDTTPPPATKEALRYKHALYAGWESLKERPLSTKTAQEVCSVLQARPALIRSTPGTYIGDPATGKRHYTPPEGKEIIENHLANLEKFLYPAKESPYDPLTIMAATHYQFEAIHPFYDGNGRTGRILNILLLIQSELITFPVLYLSSYIVENKARYYQLLREVTTQGNWEEWLLFIVEGVEKTATSTLAMINKLRDIQSTMEADIRAAGITPAKELTDLLFSSPYLRIRDVEEAGLVKRQQASHWLNSLVQQGILLDHKVGREKFFINHAALNILTA